MTTNEINHNGDNGNSTRTFLHSFEDNNGQVLGTDRPLSYNSDDWNSGNQQGAEGDTMSNSSSNASIISSVINLLNTVAGAGMLGLPGAYAGSGFIVGTLLLMIAAFFSALGLHLLSVSARTVKARTQENTPASFYTVATNAMPQFAIAIDAAVAFKCFGVATGYFVTVADCMIDSFRYVFRNVSASDESPAEEIEEMFFTNRQFWVTCALVSVLPISFFQTLDALRFTSMLSLVLIYALAVGIILFAQGIFDPCESINFSYNRLEENDQKTGSCKGETQMITNFDGAVQNLAIFVFSFTCHQNVFAITNELKKPTQKRVDKVIILAIGCALVLYMIVAIEGYTTYGTQVKGDILLNYPQNMLVTAMRVGIAIMVILSYPLQLDPCRHCLKSLVYVLMNKIQNIQQDFHIRQRSHLHVGEDEQAEQMLERLADDMPNSTMDDTNRPVETVVVDPDMRRFLDDFLFYCITCVFLVLSYVIAMSVSDLGVILGVVGATGSTMVSYILPGKISSVL
jgi:amino acid permease